MKVEKKIFSEEDLNEYDHFSSNLKTPIRDDAFDLSDKEKIEIIKSKGVMYSEETLLHLLKLVARENYVNLNLDGDIYSSKQSILQLMKNIEEHDDEMDSELLTLMTEMIENYDEVRQIHSSKLREVRNYLITNTETLKKLIK